jgi:hypothetical protein
VSNYKNGWNKLWPEANDGEPKKTENVSVDEIVQLCNSVPKSEDITPAEVTEWLGCDNLDGGFDILNDDEIVSSVIDNEEEKIDDGECYILNEKSTLSHTAAETMLSKCIEWFEGQEEANPTQVLLLRKVRKIAAQKAGASNRSKIKCVVIGF